MKNATAYERKVKKLLAGVTKTAQPSVRSDSMEALLQAILQADAPRKAAEKALDELLGEFVDVNELRVAPQKEITDCMGKGFARARDKAQMMISVLNRIFDHSNTLSLDYVVELPKREIRRHLRELGLDAYAAALLLLTRFGGHAVPVDQMLADCLSADEYIHPGSDIADVQGFLERIVPQKDAPATHEFLRAYAEKRCRTLPRKPEPAPPAQPAPAPAAAAAPKPAPEAKPAATPKAAAASKPAPKPAPAKPSHPKPAANKTAPKAKPKAARSSAS